MAWLHPHDASLAVAAGALAMQWASDAHVRAAWGAARLAAGIEGDGDGDAYSVAPSTHGAVAAVARATRSSTGGGDTDIGCWDVGALWFLRPSYRVPWPLSEVITGTSRAGYYRVHAFMLQLRRVQELREAYVCLKRFATVRVVPCGVARCARMHK